MLSRFVLSCPCFFLVQTSFGHILLIYFSRYRCYKRVTLASAFLLYKHPNSCKKDCKTFYDMKHSVVYKLFHLRRKWTTRSSWLDSIVMFLGWQFTSLWCMKSTIHWEGVLRSSKEKHCSSKKCLWESQGHVPKTVRGLLLANFSEAWNTK